MSTHSVQFHDGKAADALRTIGEVSKALDVRQHVLRYWEEQFPMLRPLKRSGGRRLYRPEDVQLVETINRLVHHEGYTLRGARLALESSPTRTPVAALAVAVMSNPIPAMRNDSILPQLRAIRQNLAAALAD